MRTEDGSIINECLGGKPQAFGMLVDKYKAGIYAYVCAEVRNFHDAQDITQEVFIQAYRDLRSLRKWESFTFWLYRIAYTRCKKWIRTRSRRPDSEFAEDQDPKVLEKLSLDAYRDSQVDELLGEALDSLSDTYREVLMLHYFGGMTIKDIARAVGASPTAIGVRLSRARAQLKEEMITMMDTAFEGQRLHASFTFRVVEAVKRIKINPMPRTTGLPWGLSLAAGIAVVVMTLGSQMAIHQSPELTVLPGETQTLKVREMSVDILGAPGTSVMAGKQGDIDGVGMDQRSPENNSLLAPAKGGGAWTQKADMPTARSLAGSAVVDSKIYVIGGCPNSGLFTAAVEEYDPATDTWTKRANIPTARQGVRAAAVDGIIYAIGGWNDAGGDTSTVEAYDPTTDKWTRKTNMPTRRTMSAIAVVDGIIYVIGGELGVTALSAMEAYDPATDKWTRKADMPTARQQAGACVIDGRIYVSGGSPERVQGQVWPCMPTVEIYNPATDTWTQGADLPWGRYCHSASAVDGKMYIIGGADYETAKLFMEGKIELDEAEELFSTVDVYNPGTDTWTTAADFPFGRSQHSAEVVDGKIYTIGGWRDAHASFSRVDEFDPNLPDNIAVTNPAGKLLRTWGEVKSQ
jgi:RNA polymerase sigma factor (sigma-70 family)